MSGSSLALRPPNHLSLRATLGAILGAGAAYGVGCDELTCITSASLAAITIRIALIDLKLRIIHNQDVIALLIIGTIWTIWPSHDHTLELVSVLLQGFFYAAIFQTIRILYEVIRGREGLGLGDVKLAMAAGPFLTPAAFFLSVSTASMISIAYVLFRIKISSRRKSFNVRVPFGSALMISIYIFWASGFMIN